MYHEKKVLQSTNLQEMIEKLATIPLNYQPGKGWQYIVGMDIEGYLVEKLSGQSHFRYGFNVAVVFDQPTANVSDGNGTFFETMPQELGSGLIQQTMWCLFQ